MKIMLELRLFFAKIQLSAQASPLSKNSVPENRSSKAANPVCQKSAFAALFNVGSLRHAPLCPAAKLRTWLCASSLSVIFSADWPIFSSRRRFRTMFPLFDHPIVYCTQRSLTEYCCTKCSEGLAPAALKPALLYDTAREEVLPLPASSECFQTVTAFSPHQNSPLPHGKRAAGFSFLWAAGQSPSAGRSWPQSAGNNGNSRSPG